MNRLEKIRRAVVGKLSLDDIFIRNMASLDKDSEVMQNVYTHSDLVYICISTTARAISQVPLVLGKVKSNGEWEAITTGTNDWESILRHPNPIQDYATFIESIVSSLFIDGNAWVSQYPFDIGVPFALWVIQKKYMSALRDPNGQLAGWQYKPSSTNDSIMLDVKDVAHVFFWNPSDPLIGMAPAEAGRIAIVTDYKAAKFNQVFFEQGATIGGVLSTENTLTDKQYKRLKEEVEGKYSGYEKSHKMLLLDGGLNFSQTSPSHRDMMMPDLRNLDKERILQIYGMKKAVISVTDNLNKATAWQQEKAWWTSTNIPIMKMIASAFNFTFFEQLGYEARFDTSTVEALQRDFADKVKTGELLVKMGFTPNEVNARLELGFEKMDWICHKLE